LVSSKLFFFKFVYFFNKVIFIKNKENLVLKFDGIPEKKIRKRLGDFKFKWNIKKQCWEGNKDTYNTVLNYLFNNTALKIIDG
jgi:hypothetical protein